MILDMVMYITKLMFYNRNLSCTALMEGSELTKWPFIRLHRVSLRIILTSMFKDISW